MFALSLTVLVASIGLMFVLGIRIFGSVLWGFLNAGLFALTPLLWDQTRNGPASLSALPFVVGWLLVASHTPNAPAALWAIAGMLLGAGVYSSHASAVMMLVYVFMTFAVVIAIGAMPYRHLGTFAAGFAVTSAPFAIYLFVHPATFRAGVMASHLYDANRFNVLQGLREMTSWLGLTARTEVFYDYFNPSFLFLTGRVLLLPLLVLIPLGIYRIVAAESTVIAYLSLAGFLAAPFAAALTAEPPVPARIRFITPFAAVLATYGLQHLVSRRRSTRAVG